MTSEEHLISVAVEEAVEIALEASALAQRLTKALRFGLNETQPGQEHSNLRRIVDGYEKLLQEGNDLRAVLALLQLVPSFDDCSRVGADNDAVLAKQEKVQRYLAYSQECGTVTAHVGRAAFMRALHKLREAAKDRDDESAAHFLADDVLEILDGAKVEDVAADVAKDIRAVAMAAGQASVEGETPAQRIERAIEATKKMGALPLTAEECVKILQSTPGMDRSEADRVIAERCSAWADRLEGKQA